MAGKATLALSLEFWC